MNIYHSCGAGKIDDGPNACKDLNYCDSLPCYGEATCQNVTKELGFFRCICPAGWRGRLCSAGTKVELPPTSAGSPIALIVGIIAGVLGKSPCYFLVLLDLTIQLYL